jgi:hypothetical protein
MKKLLILTLLVISGAVYGQIDSIKVSTPNSRAGDPLRTAFKKANLAIDKLNLMEFDSAMVNDHVTPTKISIVVAGDSVEVVGPASGITLGIGIGDTIDNRQGNYMTRQNYHNDASNDNFFKGMVGYGSTVKSLPLCPTMASSNIPMADTRCYWVLHYIPEKKTLSGIAFQIYTAGIFTAADSNMLALYSISGTTYTRVAITDTCALSFKSTGAKSQAFHDALGGNEVTYEAEPGYYLAMVVHNNSTLNPVPGVFGSTINSALNALLPDSKDISGYTDSKAGPPLTEIASHITASTSAVYLILY